MSGPTLGRLFSPHMQIPDNSYGPCLVSKLFSFTFSYLGIKYNFSTLLQNLLLERGKSGRSKKCFFFLNC